MEIANSSLAYKKLIKVIYSCETTEQIEVARSYLDLYANMYLRNGKMALKTRIKAQERVKTAEFILRMKYRSLVA